MKIYMISRPKFERTAWQAFLDDLGSTWRRTPEATDGEELAEVAGRVCYLSVGDRQSTRSNREYIQNLISMGHESVLEHISWTVLITGVSRAFTHQLVRHRAGFAFSQLSQQYHDENDSEVVEPPHLRESQEAYQAWRRTMEAAQESYRVIYNSLSQPLESQGLGLPAKELHRAIRSVARSVLTNATETKIMVTANARAFRHFLKVRGGIPGDWEMRTVSAELLRILKVEAPSIFADFQIQELPDGSPVVIHLDSHSSSIGDGS